MRSIFKYLFVVLNTGALHSMQNEPAKRKLDESTATQGNTAKRQHTLGNTATENTIILPQNCMALIPAIKQRFETDFRQIALKQESF